MILDKEFEKVDLSCDLYGFSVYPDNIEIVAEIAKNIKGKNKKAIIFFGSAYASLYADELLEEYKHIDFIILGHGEFPLLDIINRLDEGRDINTIASQNKHIKTLLQKDMKEFCCTDINLLPWPDRLPLQTGNYISAYICDAHGCTGNCSFCAQRMNVKWTGRTAQDILDEILHIYKLTGIRIFKFTSGSFEDPGTKGKERIRELCLLLKNCETKFSFKCYLRAETFKNNSEDIELLKLMKEVGFSNILIGIESGNEDDLIFYNKRATIHDIHSILNIMDDVGIYAKQFGFIMINPYSTLDRLGKNYDFLAKYKCPFVLKYISNIFISSGTKIYYKLKNDNLLKSDFSFKRQTAYKFVDKNAEKIADFISNVLNNPADFEKHDQFYGTVELFHQIDPLVDLGSISHSFYDNLDSIFYLCKDFFSYLYKYGDVEECAKRYPEFMNNLNKYYNECNSKRNKLMRQLMKLK